MQTFQAGNDITVIVPLKDADGNDITAQAVSWRLSDDSAPLTSWTDLATYTPESPEAEITVVAANNTLAAGATGALRVLELQVTEAVTNNIFDISVSYVIQDGSLLVVGVNTFQTLPAADFAALQIPNIDSYNAATPEQKTAALVEARLHILQLNFAPLNTNKYWGQDSLNWIPEGQYNVQSTSAWILNGDLYYLTPDQFLKLPQRMLDALRRAQIVEADAILGGNALEDKRRAGVTLDAVGQSKLMFRAGVPIKMPVCSRALSYLSIFITTQKKIGRK